MEQYALRFAGAFLLMGGGYALGAGDFWVGLYFAAIGGLISDATH